MAEQNARSWGTILGAMAFVAAISTVLVFTAPSGRADTSAAVATPTWSTLSPPGAPPGLHAASATYDADNQTVVLFGGVRGDGSVSGDTWIWNGSTWTQSRTAGPSARQGASMAYDAGMHQLILFGGQAVDGSLLNDSWAWNGESWVSATPVPAAGLPPARSGASLAVDSSGGMVLFGGTGAPVSAGGAPVTLNDTWTWGGSGWTQPSLAPSTSPPARTGASLTWDAALHQTVLFAGSATPVAEGAPTLLDDTWTWNGSAWTQVATPSAPPARMAAVSASAGALGADLVATGTEPTGAGNDTWAFDGTTWSAVSAASPPGGRTAAAGDWDSASGQWVVFGGLDAATTTLADTVVLTATAPVVTNPTSVANTQPGAATTSTSAPAAGHPVRTTTTAPATRAPVPPAGASSSTTAEVGTTTTTVVRRAVPGIPTPGPRTPTAVPAPRALPTGEQTVHGGSLVTLLGSGFRPWTVVTITFHSLPYTVGRVTADVHGSFSATVAVPAGASLGRHHLVAAGMGLTGTMNTLITPLQVVALPGAVPGGSATTTIVLVAVAILIPVATWIVLSLGGRRRSPLAPR